LSYRSAQCKNQRYTTIHLEEAEEVWPNRRGLTEEVWPNGRGVA